MGRKVFYGAMVGEGIIALVWATLGLSFYQNVEGLNEALAIGGPAYVVNEISTTLLGGFGGLLAVIGVIILPISSGDTAFRSARLIIADMLNFDQKPHLKRLAICIPLFAVGFLVSRSNFGVIWRYFGWANQTLATVVLWAAAAYLIKLGKFHWIASIPATFMTAVTITYLAYAKIGFGLNLQISTYIGVTASIVSGIAFFVAFRKSGSAEESEAITA
jgi:carbon starvation protein CstA